MRGGIIEKLSHYFGRGLCAVGLFCCDAVKLQ